jgi:hypothetical protein
VDVARTSVMMVLSIVLPLAVQLWDKRRLAAPARARSWNVATWASALYAFGPLSMLGWGWVTRRRWIRCLVGPAWAAAIALVMQLVDAFFVSAFEVRDEAPLGERLMVSALLFLPLALLLAVMELVVTVVRLFTPASR